jgi:predicted O-linked N-acetylglucosamine transferase (SPINDLY family)
MKKSSVDAASAFGHALQLHRAGRLTDAKESYRRIAKAKPTHFESRHLLGIVCHQLGDHEEAVRHITLALKIDPRNASAHVNRGVVLQHLKRFDEALVSYEQAIAFGPNDPVSFHNRGNVLKELKRLDEAIASYNRAIALDRAYWGALYNRANTLRELKRLDAALTDYDAVIALKPDHLEAHLNRGITLSELRRFDDAITSYDRVIAVKPDHVETLINRAIVLHELMRWDDALATFDKAINLNPNQAEAFNCRGNTLRKLERFDEAVASYDRAIAIEPHYAEAFSNRGDALLRQRRLAEALASCERAIALKPNYAEGYINLGIALMETGRFDEALISYSKAIERKPSDPHAFYNQGIVLERLQLFEAAVASYDEAIARKPDYADAFHNRGISLGKLMRLDEARASYVRAIALNPEHKNAFSDLADCELKLCDWTRREELLAELRCRVTAGRSCINPFTLMGYSDDEALQLLCAKNFTQDRFGESPRLLSTDAVWRNERIKVAYLSADFRHHAIGHLTAGLFERHNRARFEVIGVSFSPDDGSEIRTRLVTAFDQFLDVRTKSDDEVAQLLRDLQIDIAVDLNGHTEGGRLGILARRPAPIQVNYLGFPGTTGANFMDYIIADEVVLPFSQQPYYCEHIVHLPGCYQANDKWRAIAPRKPTRQELGLPSEGVVFCCLNNTWKITPPMFDVWTRLLRAVENSALWLMGGGEQAEGNLRQEAAIRGVDPARVVFAGQLPLRDHLARHCVADLFLDTLPYNAHTTASDALWSGLPVLTCRGKAFPGRVAASLLTTAGMPELITSTLEEYEALAFRVATSPALRRELREKLEKNRLQFPLFDTDRFCRQIETAYETMWERWQRGDPPHGFSVKERG